MDKNIELLQLRTIFNEREFHFTERESPDFEVSRKGSSLRFGVEITELHESGTHAEIRGGVSTYEDTFNRTGMYRKPFHQNILGRKAYSEISADEVSSAKSLINEAFRGGAIRSHATQLRNITPQSHIKELIKSIGKKEVKYPKYHKQGFNSIDLVVMDHCIWDFPSAVIEGHVCYRWDSVFTPSLITALVGSNFGEIYLSSMRGDHIYRPLQVTFLYMEIQRFLRFLNNTSHYTGWSKKDRLSLFVHMMTRQHAADVKIIRQGDKLLVGYKKYTMELSRNKNMECGIWMGQKHVNVSLISTQDLSFFHTQYSTWLASCGTSYIRMENDWNAIQYK